MTQAARAAGRHAWVQRTDVANNTQVAALSAGLDAGIAAGEITALASVINIAGKVHVDCRADAMDAARVQRLFEVNVLGGSCCAREAVRRLTTRHGGSGGATVKVSSIRDCFWRSLEQTSCQEAAKPARIHVLALRRRAFIFGA